MIDYRFTPEAEEDLFGMWCYIARDNVAGARSISERSRQSPLDSFEGRMFTTADFAWSRCLLWRRTYGR
jgi:hypothetical protein